MDKEKFTFTMEDLKPEVRTEFEKWLGFKVEDWAPLTIIYAPDDSVNEALDIFFDEEE